MQSTTMNWLQEVGDSLRGLLGNGLEQQPREEASEESRVQVKASKSYPPISKMSPLSERLSPFRLSSPGGCLTAGVAYLLTCSLVIAAAAPSHSNHRRPAHHRLQTPNEVLNQHQRPPVQIQSRAGGLEPGDYVDEASEIEVLANQQQIPTAQLMAAAGHVVPDSFFLPGGTIPAMYPRYLHHQHQVQAPADPLDQARNKLIRTNDPMAASANNHADQVGQPGNAFMDYGGYGQSDGHEVMEDLLHPAQQLALHQEQQQQHMVEQQLINELQTIVSARQQLQNLQQQGAHPANHLPTRNPQYPQTLENSAQPSENSPIEAQYAGPNAIGPAYQLAGQPGDAGVQHDLSKDKPFGLPTKGSNKEPSGMLKPFGSPKTVSSPAIDFVVNQLPKTSGLEKLADKMPQTHTPTVMSFASSKDPMDKVKGVNQKKRTVMRQAEHLAKMLIKSVNDKFGTNFGDQTDIPFLLSSLGPLGFAQNILFDPTLLVTLLNSAEKTYFSDVLPGPAKSAIRPVLNIFRVPNKKRDKANLLNVISYLKSVVT